MKAVQSKLGKILFSNRLLGREVLMAIRNNDKAVIKMGKNTIIMSKSESNEG